MFQGTENYMQMERIGWKLFPVRYLVFLDFFFVTFDHC